MANNDLLNLALERERDIKRFTRWRPSIERSYDDLLADIRSGELSVNYVPEDKWDAYKEENWRGRSMPEGHSLEGWYSDDKIHIPDTDYAREHSLPHEIMHYFAGHKAGGHGTPEQINPYIKADMKLGGWLPSLHPGGRRPTLPGKTKLGQWWNENIATKNVDYSDKDNYHPWFDEHAFDTALTDRHDHEDSSVTARDYARDFDVNSPESVRIMQDKLNKAGYTDYEGNPLNVDGVLGDKTLSALRNLQGVPSRKFGFKETPDMPSQLSTESNFTQGYPRKALY